jgi:heparin/heparan-sulfate lyase
MIPVFLLLFAAVASPAELKWTEVNGVRIVLPPAEHPRLYLRARDLPDLKRRMTDPVLKPIWEELQTLAKSNADLRLRLDALTYLLDHDTKRAERVVAESLRQVEELKLSEEKVHNSRRPGTVILTAAMVYDWCYPVLTAEQKAAFPPGLVRVAKNLECGYPPDKGSFVIGHPSEWMIQRDMLSAGVAIYDEFPEMYRLAAARFFGSHLPARNWFYPGGAYHQGPGYADARFVSDTYPLWIFDRMGAGDVYDRSQQYVPYEYIYERRPDNHYMWSGDGHNWPSRLGSLLCGSYYHDGYVLSNYLLDPDPVDVPTARQGYDPRMDKLFAFLWRDPDLKPLPLTDLPLSHYMGFPYGWMVARTGWDASSVIAEMRVNIYNFGGHQHRDAGDFSVYYKGPLSLHTGVYQGTNGSFGGSHFANYYQRTIAHNSLLIYDPKENFGASRNKEIANDGGQRPINSGKEPRVLEDMLTAQHKTGEVLGRDFGPDPKNPAYTYLKGDITAAYSSKVKNVERSFVFLNLGGSAVPAALVVFDRVVSANPAFQKFWLLHSMEEPSIEGNTARLTASGHGWNGQLVNTTVLPQEGNARLTKIGGPGKEFWVFGKNYPNSENPPDPESGAWRVELSPRQPAATDLFLNVVQVMDRGSSARLPVEKVESKELTGVRVADRVVLFNPAGGRLAQPVSFAARGDGTLRFLVADLAAGSWQVLRGGHAAGKPVAVSKDAGTLYFEGPAGSYTLKR